MESLMHGHIMNSSKNQTDENNDNEKLLSQDFMSLVNLYMIPKKQ
jgi:hypothetical protein